MIDLAKTVRIVLAIQSHPVSAPGHQLIKECPDLEILRDLLRFWNDSADNAKLRSDDSRENFKGLKWKYARWRQEKSEWKEWMKRVYAHLGTLRHTYTPEVKTRSLKSRLKKVCEKMSCEKMSSWINFDVEIFSHLKKEMEQNSLSEIDAFQQMARRRDGVALGTGEVLKQLIFVLNKCAL